jgi:hypothetical protein
MTKSVVSPTPSRRPRRIKHRQRGSANYTTPLQLQTVPESTASSQLIFDSCIFQTCKRLDPAATQSRHIWDSDAITVADHKGVFSHRGPSLHLVTRSSERGRTSLKLTSHGGIHRIALQHPSNWPKHAVDSALLIQKDSDTNLPRFAFVTHTPPTSLWLALDVIHSDKTVERVALNAGDLTLNRTPDWWWSPSMETAVHHEERHRNDKEPLTVNISIAAISTEFEDALAAEGCRVN